MMLNSNLGKPLVFTAMRIPGLSEILISLPTEGNVKQTFNNFLYLDIDDRYIHEIFSLLKQSKLQKPDYFSIETNVIGAHISIIYPDELIEVKTNFIGKRYDFTIDGLFFTEIFNTRYFALKVQAPGLLAIRQQYALPEKLKIYDYYIDFHITVAKKLL